MRQKVKQMIVEHFEITIDEAEHITSKIFMDDVPMRWMRR